MGVGVGISLRQCYSLEQLVDAYVERQFEENHVIREFPEKVYELTSESIKVRNLTERKDLRGLKCFTVDCDDTKDMDDAISLEVAEQGYRLGVHIADVAAYITPFTLLDQVATARGYSIYLPKETVSMLPVLLSNNLCSLNPNKERLTVSVLIDLDCEGRVIRYSVCKSCICSKIKGAYSEVNALLQGNASGFIREKYKLVKNEIIAMNILAQKMRKKREAIGVDFTEENEQKVHFEKGEIVIKNRDKGAAEQLIEEFMVLANTLIAEYFIENNLPVVFRAQTEKGTVAIYTTEECHHAELGLDHYAHFTSPIRRLADLKIHQILTLHLEGVRSEIIHAMLDEHLCEIAEQAKKTKGRADNIMKACSNYCLKLWAEANPNEEYKARIIGKEGDNKLIMEILPYRIRVSSSWADKATVGKVLSCKLMTNPTNNRLRAVIV